MQLPPITPKRLLSGILLTALLLLLALRLGGAETLYESLQQKAATVIAATTPRGPDNPGPLPFAGPAFTTAYAAAALLLAGLAALLAGAAMPPRRLGQALLMALILALLGISAAHAANRVNALIGTADIASALASAFTLALLCDDALLGAAARRAAIAAITAILAMGAAKALLQYFVEYPDLAEFVKEHRDEALRQQGIDPADTVQTKIFIGRLNSQEVTGFGFYSNVFATQMIALLGVLAAFLVAAFRQLKTVPLPPLSPAQPKSQIMPASPAHLKSSTPQVSAFVLELILVSFLALASCAAIRMTDSKGGIAAAILAILAITASGIFARRLLPRRRLLLKLTAAATLASAAAVILYGQAHHGLPTKSLLFRWQYWTASIPIIHQFPTWGTGINNFGDYYLRYKAPSSPENVKDPHNFFIRLAAEAGIPATLALCTLLLWFLWQTFSLTRTSPPTASAKAPASTPIFPWQSIPAVILAALAWSLLRMLGIPYTDFEFIMSFLYAALGAAIFVATFHLLCHLETASPIESRADYVNPTRFIAVAAVLAALAMLLYDQVNMALVTGPCAMLFWMLLALGDSSHNSIPQKSPSPRLLFRLSTIATGTLSLLAGIATLFTLTLPVGSSTFPLDPAPYEYNYIRQYDQLTQDLARRDQPASLHDALLAGQNLDRAIALSPENGELYTQRIVFHRFLAQQGLPSVPLAPDIRKVLTLDRANARVRLDLAFPDSDLPNAERIRALHEALDFDVALPADEPKRLTESQQAAVRAKIIALQNQ